MTPRSLTLARLRALCLALPEAIEKPAWGQPTWRAGTGKIFVQVNDNADSVVFPCDHVTQQILVETDPAHLFVPRYVGVKGWVGAKLGDDVDWQQIAALAVDAYRRVAAKKLVPLVDEPRYEPAALARHALDHAVVDEAADAALVERANIAAVALERMRDICTGLPSLEERPGHHTGFLVKGKAFAWLTVNHHGDEMVAVQVKAAPGVQDMLVSVDPSRFFVPPFMGKNGWVSVRVDVPYVDWDEIAALMLDSYRLIAPKKLAAQIAK